MKTNLFSRLLCAALLFLFIENKAQTRLLHYWHFNNVPSGHIGTRILPSDYTKPGITNGYLRNVKLAATVSDTGYWDNGTPGDTINQRLGFGGCCSATATAFVRTRNPNDSMQFLWYIPTTNFKNIVIKYGSESSSTGSGPARQKYEYSLDSGLNFITTGLPRLFDSAGTSFGKVILNLSSILAVNNTNKLMLRIRVSAPNTGGSGNTRYDNITVEGDTIGTAVATGVQEISISARGYILYPNPSNGFIQLSSPNGTVKHVVITDLMGQIIFVADIEEKAPLDISLLNRGVYFIKVNEFNSTTVNTFKFIKN